MNGQSRFTLADLVGPRRTRRDSVTPKRRIRPLLWLAIGLVLAQPGLAQVEITLENSFIDKYHNRATIVAQYVVDKAHAKPNPPAKDGDLHAAGRSPEIGLPAVAEIMNAAANPRAVAAIHAGESDPDHKPLAITGAWRIWCEHGGNVQQTQGAPLEPFDTTNPFHVFEVHPITRIGELDLTASLKPITGFDTKDARTAFTAYEGRSCRIRPEPDHDTTTITTNIVGYNYVEFKMDPNGRRFDFPDGTAVIADVYDLDDELLVKNRRMIFVQDTPPALAFGRRKQGDGLMHVLGIPRIDLALVAWRRDHANDRPDVLTWGLPYEIVIVGNYARGSTSTSGAGHHGSNPGE